MIIQVNLPDDSLELDELNFIVNKINVENPDNSITVSQYVQNIVSGYFRNRVLNEYVGYAKKQTPDELKIKFGKLSDIRSK